MFSPSVTVDATEVFVLFNTSAALSVLVFNSVVNVFSSCANLSTILTNFCIFNKLLILVPMPNLSAALVSSLGNLNAETVLSKPSALLPPNTSLIIGSDIARLNSAPKFPRDISRFLDISSLISFNKLPLLVPSVLLLSSVVTAVSILPMFFCTSFDCIFSTADSPRLFKSSGHNPCITVVNLLLSKRSPAFFKAAAAASGLASVIIL